MTQLLLKLFVKDYKDTSDPSVREAYGKLSGITGIVTNLLLCAVKITAGVLAGSISIIADAVNNLSDSGSAIVTLISFKISGKPADAGHPYGHARMEYVSGLIVSITIMFLGLELFLNSVRKIIEPQEMVFSWLIVLILAFSILLKLWLCLFYRKLGRAINSDAISAAMVDSRNDILATSAVLAALQVSGFTGFNTDGWMGAAVAVFITVSGIRLIKDTVSPLLGMAPSKEMVDRIYRKIMSYDGIVGLHDLTVHNYGVGKYFASVHCEVSADRDIMVGHDIIDNIERDFLKDLGIHLVIHLDPVITDNEKINNLKSAVDSLVRDISPEISIHDFRVFFGITHSKLIFDVVVPYGFKYSDDELVGIISGKIREIDDNYRAVITVDHHYVPDFHKE
ncbi:MAG TPA: cation diffusion facilitator family transporter [Clostridiales bacterium]|nr:cation diffusion facilitator family transporter [Clostridiales bacterium]